jgi:hypothetical protein
MLLEEERRIKQHVFGCWENVVLVFSLIFKEGGMSHGLGGGGGGSCSGVSLIISLHADKPFVSIIHNTCTKTIEIQA